MGAKGKLVQATTKRGWNLRKDERGRETARPSFALRGVQALEAALRMGLRLCPALPGRRAAEVRQCAQGVRS